MNIQNITKSIVSEFTVFMLKLEVIEKNLDKMQSMLQAEIDKASAQVEFQKSQSKIVEEQSETLRNKIIASNDKLKESQMKADSSDQILAGCKEKEASIKKRQEELSIQEVSAKEIMQDANKRLAWAEMEERRLKFLQKKIDLVTQDEAIKKKLQELE